MGLDRLVALGSILMDIPCTNPKWIVKITVSCRPVRRNIKHMFWWFLSKCECAVCSNMAHIFPSIAKAEWGLGLYEFASGYLFNFDFIFSKLNSTTLFWNVWMCLVKSYFDKQFHIMEIRLHKDISSFALYRGHLYRFYDFLHLCKCYLFSCNYLIFNFTLKFFVSLDNQALHMNY